MLYIIRHGQTARNRAHVLQGRSDLPLNETGILQGKEAAAWFKDKGIAFSHIFSSPLQRALQTARLIVGDQTVSIDDRLIEMDYGPYEGSDLRDPAPEVRSFFIDFAHTPAPEGMEQLSSVVERAGLFLEEIRYLKGDILVSTHAIAMKGMLEYLTPASEGAYWSKHIGNCAVYAASHSDGFFGVPGEMFSIKRP